MESKEPVEAVVPVGAGVDGSTQAWRGFTVARLPRILFGAGRSGELGKVVREFGRDALVVTRGPGFVATADWTRLLVALETAGVVVSVEAVSGEPSPALVDEIVARHRASGAAPVDVVVGIGGGSVLDCAKAVAGLLIPGNSVMDHLEGIGPELLYRGPSVPFIAVPTTAGTGSEATKNAVLSSRGAAPFKKSFRDEALVAQVAIVDPDLLGSCPPELIAGNGMDALTQLLESYVSLRANPFTDALALSGLACIRDGLLPWFQEAVAGRGADSAGSVAAAARERMAYAALCSGICLAQAGLGAVHGLASPLGAQFPIPHGAACGATLATATLINIAALETRDPGGVALSRYAVAGWILSGVGGAGDREARAALVTALEQLTALLNVPRLSAYGVTTASIPALVADSRGSSMKTNPIELTDEEIGAVLLAAL
ncbi:MAG TPA: iron-containing alcohol dehydrogenase [Candidatus Limnocylindrales bacterium]